MKPTIKKNINLKNFNTFKLPCIAENFAVLSEIDELEYILKRMPHNNIFILGKGSNIVFQKETIQNVILNNILGVKIIQEDAEALILETGSGMAWDDLVNFCVLQNRGGIENLAAIPGSVGVAPIQNIGAYGVEFKNVFVKLLAYHFYDKKFIEINAAEAQLGYRDSIFKHELKNKIFICSVQIKLIKNPKKFNISYPSVQQYFEEHKHIELNLKTVADVIRTIRSAKLPSLNEYGNAGSFFKNPTICTEQFDSIKRRFPELHGYLLPNDTLKLSAAQLIDLTGAKKLLHAEVACYSKHPLVIINKGKAQGHDIVSFAKEIRKIVFDKAHINLEFEIDII
ncbi:MAG: UDP-N-acetylmuramate dehydrogenase [Alphaproteobacteria bacterium]|nr:UDP-N-acetylmuramate dehydrogenase [Alphaproteobacteria bacterium]